MMSDSDDSDILADIQALDQVLATTSQENVQYPSSGRVQFENIYSSDVDSEIDDNYDFVREIQDVDMSSLNAFEINMKLITSLTIVKHKFTAVLRQCEEKIKELDQQLANCATESTQSPKLPISCAGMPYFKDKNYFSAPKNYDTKLKEARGELFVVSLPKPSRWSSKDREILLRAVHNEAFESVLSGEFDEQVDKKVKCKGNNQAEETKLVLPRNFDEMVGALGEREFDWLKISNIDFDGKHSAGECRAMWNVYLHPEIRKTEWTTAEDNKLLKCAQLCKYQDWDTIAQMLGTSRSGYQCFIRYNTIKKVPSSGRPWTKQEDKHLLRVIKTLRVGNYIPWSEVANYLRHRTKQQIYTRWAYRKAPHLKKGRFTFAETQQLLRAMEKYGKNFCKIANVVMLNRTSSQLINHYNTIIAKKKNGRNLWTQDTDMQLIQLHKKYGNDWSKIATYFSDKTRTQVRHRFTAVLKYIKRGISVESIPRVPVSKKVYYKKSERTIVSERNKKALVEKLLEKAKHRTINISDIEPRLYETFLFPFSSELPTQEEPYNFKSLACDTKRLYNTLELLDAKLDIPMDEFLNYVRVNERDKELLISLIEYISMINNKAQNQEVIEEFRTRMFGPEPKVNESSRFIPPLPFNGHVRKTRKTRKKDRVIDCNLEVDKNLVDVPVEFSLCVLTQSFLSSEENIQFDRFSQFLINDCHEKQNVNSQKSLQCSSSFGKSRSSSRRNKSNANSKASSRDRTQVEQSSNLRKPTSAECNENDEEKNTLNNTMLPNKATLFGCKNLLLWKLLYEYENESDECDELSSSEKQSEEPETSSAEYQLLRTRLIKLFKFPIGLSNTILEVTTPNTIFLTKEEQLPENTLRKEKSTDVKRVSKRKR